VRWGISIALVILGVLVAGILPSSSSAGYFGDNASPWISAVTVNMSTGQSRDLAITFQNIGTTYWSSISDHYKLCEHSTGVCFNLPRSGIFACDPLSPQHSCIWGLTFNPTAPGTFIYYFQMYNLGWFGDTMTLTLVVTDTPTNTPLPTALPTQTPSPTRTLTPSPIPTTRPNVGVQVAPTGPQGTLQATISARSQGCPNNQLQALRFTRLDNATVDVPGTPLVTVSAPTTIPLTSHPQSVVLTLRRVSSGAATAQLTVVDSCGEWPTFVGGGPGAF
jgi:hypothetical protein